MGSSVTFLGERFEILRELEGRLWLGLTHLNQQVLSLTEPKPTLDQTSSHWDTINGKFPKDPLMWISRRKNPIIKKNTENPVFLQMEYPLTLGMLPWKSVAQTCNPFFQKEPIHIWYPSIKRKRVRRINGFSQMSMQSWPSICILCVFKKEEYHIRLVCNLSWNTWWAFLGLHERVPLHDAYKQWTLPICSAAFRPYYFGPTSRTNCWSGAAAAVSSRAAQQQHNTEHHAIHDLSWGLLHFLSV